MSRLSKLIAALSRNVVRRQLFRDALRQVNQRDMQPVYNDAGRHAGWTGDKRKERRQQARAIAKGWWREGRRS